MTTVFKRSQYIHIEGTIKFQYVLCLCQYLRLNKNERAKCECRQCLSKGEVQKWYMAPCQNRWDFGLLLKLVSPRFMDSTLSYGPKRKGPPSIAKDWRLAVLLLHCVLFPVIINGF